jgi:Fe-S-cluster containining protein
MSAVASATPREKGVHCNRCDALCCRLTVVVFPEDDIAPHLTERDIRGTTVMARDADGWCVALDQARMNCGIYAGRPSICRKFAMAGPYCLQVRADARSAAAGLTVTLIPVSPST